MKNATFSGNILTRLIKPSFFALLFLGLVSTSPAQATGDNPKEAPAAVKYLGSVDGKPTFQIAVNNPQGETVSLALRDEEGYLIFSDMIKDKAYTRKLQFDGLDADKMKLTLILRTKKDTKTQTFEITKSTRTVEDVAVVSL